MEGFFMGLDIRLYMSSSNLPSIIFLAMGKGDLSLAMLRYSKRPDIFAAMTLCQFLMWYREMRRGQEDAQPRHQGLPKVVVTAVDLTPQPAPPPLPLRLHLQDGTVMVKRRKPCPVNWAPLGAHSDIVMFKVLSHFLKFLPEIMFPCPFVQETIVGFVVFLLQYFPI